jgi:hypothetical protein
MIYIKWGKGREARPLLGNECHVKRVFAGHFPR